MKQKNDFMDCGWKWAGILTCPNLFATDPFATINESPSGALRTSRFSGP